MKRRPRFTDAQLAAIRLVVRGLAWIPVKYYEELREVGRVLDQYLDEKGGQREDSGGK
jgi:hypothetical protein